MKEKVNPENMTGKASHLPPMLATIAMKAVGLHLRGGPRDLLPTGKDPRADQALLPDGTHHMSHMCPLSFHMNGNVAETNKIEINFKFLLLLNLQSFCHYVSSQ